MPSEPPSIPHLKQSFLRSQIRLLTTPLTTPTTLPPPPFPTDSSHSSSSTPSAKLLVSILQKSNQKVRLHNKLVFSEQATRHVAEQIDALYWEDVLDQQGRVERGYVGVKRDVEFTVTQDVQGLPGGAVLTTEVSGKGGGSAGVGGLSREEGKKYEELRMKLVELVRKRDQARRVVRERRRVRGLMVPFEDARGRVQGNLVTRDGEVGRELGRLRVLLARVGEKVREMDGSRKGDALQESMVQSERNKVVEVLGLS